MSQPQPSAEASAPALTGSLGTVPLTDILTLLAGSAQTGELHVVGPGVDGRVWFDGGGLTKARVGATTTISQSVFELVCVPEGRFSFTPGRPMSGEPAVSVAAVLDDVRPQVDEWHHILELMPLDSTVRLAPDPPGDDIQIRGDQWRVLALVGAGGHSVRALLESIGVDHMTAIHTLRELSRAGLIMLESAAFSDTLRDWVAPSNGHTTDAAPVVRPFDTPIVTSSSVPAGPPSEVPAATIATPDHQTGTPVGSLADVAIMPPPITADPWAPVAPSEGSSTSSRANGST